MINTITKNKTNTLKKIDLKDKYIILGIKPEMKKRGGVYGGAQWAWRANKKRAELADYVIVVELGTKGLIIGIIEPDLWDYTSIKKGRNADKIYFVGKNSTNIKHKSYINKKFIPDNLVPVRYPVRYNY